MESNNWILLVCLVAGVITLVYFIIPKLAGKGNSDKVIKLILALSALGYLTFDFYRKEKYAYMPFTLIGMGLFVYLILISKKKD